MPLFFVGFKMRALLIQLALAAAVMAALNGILQVSWWVAWFGGINIVTFFLMGKDKLAATSGWRRTPEAVLLAMAFCGGFPGLFSGRYLFNHKTSKTSFVSSMWMLFALQLACVAYFVGNITTLEQLLGSIGIEKRIETPAEQ